MGEEIKYRYCMTCKVRYKATDDPRQTCTKCGALLADTPTGVKTPAGQKVKPAAAGNTPPAPRAAVSQPAVATVTAASQTEAEAPVAKAPVATGDFSCTPGDVFLCLLHNILTGIPVVGLFWCGFSVIKNPLKNRVSKGTIVAGLIANVLSAILLILLSTVFKS